MTHLSVSTGQTIEHIEATLDGPRLLQLTGYLARNPPVHMLVKWFMGLETEDTQHSSGPQTDEEKRQRFIEEFQAACGQ